MAVILIDRRRLWMLRLQRRLSVGMLKLIVVLDFAGVRVGLARLRATVGRELLDRMLVEIFGFAGDLRLHIGVLNHPALDALAIAAATRIAVTRTTAVGAIFALFFSFAMGALVGFDQRLTIGNRDLIVVRMNFTEGEKAVAITAVLDEGRLKRRLDARDLRQIDIAA